MSKHDQQSGGEQYLEMKYLAMIDAVNDAQREELRSQLIHKPEFFDSREPIEQDTFVALSQLSDDELARLTKIKHLAGIHGKLGNILNNLSYMTGDKRYVNAWNLNLD